MVQILFFAYLRELESNDDFHYLILTLHNYIVK